MKKFNLAALPLAVAGVFASTSAFAGTQACFEIYKGADALEVLAFADLYTKASCQSEAEREANIAAPGVVDADNLSPTNELAIAYELTGDLDIDFDALDGVDTDQHIIYIPTTDIPGGTNIKMRLGGGATFANNSNQIHLVKYDEVAADGSFLAVASSDGPVDGEEEIIFLTKAGTTIGAGTRLAFSLVSTGGASATPGADVIPVGLNITNTDCTETTSSKTVTIQATEAVTDGGSGYNIIGAVSQTQDIADISAQFWAFQGGSTAEVNVNAESSDSENTAIVARTEFVYDASAATNSQLVAKQYEAVYKTAFYNRGVTAVLDQFVTLSADDELASKFIATAAPGDDVKMALWNARTATTGVLGTQVDIETGNQEVGFDLDDATATVYDTEVEGTTGVFTEVDGGLDPETSSTTNPVLVGAEYNEMYYVVTNTDPSAIMNFNYQVDVNYTLDFDNTDYIDHCEKSVDTHKIGVNGAVLKVPYVTTATGNFVRVTNEHDEEAEVTFDMFGESVDGNEANRHVAAVALGTVPAKSSVVYMMTDVLAAAEAEGYLGADGGYAAGDLGDNFQSSNSRHTVTFTVTAPRDSVHGVSVQKIIGAVADRVMPVLDQNDWSQ